MKDLLQEIERSCAADRAERAAKERASSPPGGGGGANPSFGNHPLGSTAGGGGGGGGGIGGGVTSRARGPLSEEERRYRSFLSSRRLARHQRLLELSFVSNFSAPTVGGRRRRTPQAFATEEELELEPRVPYDQRNDALYYDAERDRECPLAWARRLNRLQSSKRLAAVGGERCSKAEPTHSPVLATR